MRWRRKFAKRVWLGALSGLLVCAAAANTPAQESLKTEAEAETPAKPSNALLDPFQRWIQLQQQIRALKDERDKLADPTVRPIPTPKPTPPNEIGSNE